MKRISILSKAICGLIITLTLVSGCLPGRKKDRPELPPGYTYVPVLTEILPVPTGEGYPWIEFYNPLERKTDASGLKIVINDSFEYSIPDKLPPVPPKGFILLQLDGKGEGANSYKYKEKIAVLHSSSELAKAMETGPGQIAIHKISDRDKTELVGFVAWGAPGSKKSLTLERDRIWGARSFVNMQASFGDYNPDATVKAGHSIGLYPDSKTMKLRDWVVYSDSEITPGKENAIPAPLDYDSNEIRQPNPKVGREHLQPEVPLGDRDLGQRNHKK